MGRRLAAEEAASRSDAQRAAEMAMEATPLMLQLADTSPVARAVALDELRKQPPLSHVPQAPVMCRMLDDANSGVRRAALEAMSLLPIEERAKALGSSVTERLASSTDGVRHAAIWALAKIPAEERASCAASMRDKLQHEDPKVRSAALTALGMLHLDDRNAKHAAVVVKLLDDPDAGVRRDALWGMGKMPEALIKYAPEVVLRLADDDAWVRQVRGEEAPCTCCMCYV